MTLAERRGLRLLTLALLFFAQGIPWGFMAITLPAYLTDGLSARGLDEAAVTAAIGTVVAATTLPYSFKFVWGPLIDALQIPRLGRRRPWIVLAQTMMAATVALLLALDDFAASFDVLVALLLVHTSFNALQNVAVDALAIELLDASERGRANGLMYGSKYAGGAVGGLGMATLIEHSSMHTAIVVQAIVLAAITLVPLFVRERSGPPEPRLPLRELARTAGRLARLRSIRLTCLVMFTSYIANGILSAVAFPLFLKRLHWSVVDYGQFVGGPALLVGAGGSALGGFLADKIGHRRLAGIASATLAVVWIAFALARSWWDVEAVGYVLLVLEPLAQGAMTVALFTLCMDTSLPRTAATQYVAYTSLVNLATTLSAKFLSAHVLATFDYRGTYLVAGAIQLSGIALLPFIDPQEARRELS